MKVVNSFYSRFFEATIFGRIATNTDLSLDRQAHKHRSTSASGVKVSLEGARDRIALCDERNEGNNERKDKSDKTGGNERSKAREKSANRGDN